MLAAYIHPTHHYAVKSELTTLQGSAVATKLTEWLAVLTFVEPQADAHARGRKKARVETLYGGRSDDEGDGMQEEEDMDEDASSDEDEAALENARKMAWSAHMTACEGVVKGIVAALKDFSKSAALKRCENDTDRARVPFVDYKSPEGMHSLFMDFIDDELLRHPALMLSQPGWRQLARVLMSAPATEASAERGFSCSGLIDAPLRSRMSAAMLEKLSVLSTFLKSFRLREHGEGVRGFLQRLEAFIMQEQDLYELVQYYYHTINS